jgi:hypothetical protein
VKVLTPKISSRMEQSDDLFCVRVEACDIVSLEAVGVDACQRQVFKILKAAVLPRDDVVDVERKKLCRGWEPAVLATSASAVVNSADQVRAHSWVLPVAFSARRALDCIIASRLPTWI